MVVLGEAWMDDAMGDVAVSRSAKIKYTRCFSALD